MKNTTTTTTFSRKPDWWIYVVPLLLLLCALFNYILWRRPGKIGIAVYYLGPMLLAAIATLFLILGLVQSALRRPFLSAWRLLGFCGLLLFPLLLLFRADQGGNLFNAYPSSHEGEQSSLVFRLPMDGPITVGWGGDAVSGNYHVTTPDQRWAYDLLVTKLGKSYTGDSTKPENYYCYGLPVLAPIQGEVVAVADSFGNQRIGDLTETVHPGGNQIVLKVAEKCYLFLCHLKPGSIRVRKGDVVQQGQALAAIGNSGHTSEPHLHIHLQDSPQDDLGEGIPLYFSNYVSNGRFVRRGMPVGGFDEQGRFIGETVEDQSGVRASLVIRK